MKTVLLILALAFSSHAFAKGERQSVSAQVKGELLAVFAANEKLHDAFFKYEEQKEKIPVLGKELSQSIDKVSDPKIKKLLGFSQKKLAELSAKSEKSENDQRYHLVSMALIHVLNSYDIGGDYNAYSCPMVKKKWVQNSKKIAQVHNPYAPGMQHCGSKDSDF